MSMVDSYIFWLKLLTHKNMEVYEGFMLRPQKIVMILCVRDLHPLQVWILFVDL
jgi:hypothetical protein